MNYSEFPGFLATAFALMGSPGPATLSLAAAGAAYRFKDVRAYFFGIMTGVVIVILGVAAGLVTAVLAIPHAAPVLTVLSFAYLVSIAYKIAFAPPIGEQNAASAAPGFLSGVVLNLTNLKAYATFAALFSGFNLMPQAPITSAAIKAFICITMVSVINSTWLIAGRALRRQLQDRRIGKLINWGFAILLIVSVAAAALVSGF